MTPSCERLASGRIVASGQHACHCRHRPLCTTSLITGFQAHHLPLDRACAADRQCRLRAVGAPPWWLHSVLCDNLAAARIEGPGRRLVRRTRARRRRSSNGRGRSRAVARRSGEVLLQLALLLLLDVCPPVSVDKLALLPRCSFHATECTLKCSRVWLQDPRVLTLMTIQIRVQSEYGVLLGRKVAVDQGTVRPPRRVVLRFSVGPTTVRIRRVVVGRLRPGCVHLVFHFPRADALPAPHRIRRNVSGNQFSIVPLETTIHLHGPK